MTATVELDKIGKAGCRHATCYTFPHPERSEDMPKKPPHAEDAVNIPPQPAYGISDDLKQKLKLITGLAVTFALDRLFEYLERKQVFALNQPQPAATPEQPQPPAEPPK